MSTMLRFSKMLWGRWKQKKNVFSFRDWLVLAYDLILREFPESRLPYRGRLTSLRLAQYKCPLSARFGTSDFLVLDELFFRKEYDFLFQTNLGEVRTIVDLGANCGFSIRLWLRHFPNARIVAVEPDEGNVAVLRRNIPDVAQQRVRIVEACVAGTSKDVYFDRRSDEWCFSISDTPIPGAQLVRTKTLLEILDSFAFNGPIDLLKCDIEGAESDLFRNSAPWLKRARNIVVEVHPPQYDSERLAEDLERAGGNFSITPITPDSGNQILFLQQRDSCNIPHLVGSGIRPELDWNE